MNPQENIPVHIRRRIHLIDKVIDNLLPNMYPCDYNSSDHFVEGVLDEVFYFLRAEPDFYGTDLISINDFILDHKYDELTNYFNEHCIVLKNDNLQESIRRILREETKSGKYTKAIQGILEYFKNEDCVCDIDMWYDDEDDMYLVYLVFGTEELNDKFTSDGKFGYVRKKQKEVEETIKSYLPIKNIRVGSYGKPNCGWNPLTESEEKKSRLLSAIEEDGLYQVIQDTGLSMGQIILKYDNLPREVFERSIKDFINEEGYHQTDGSVQLNYVVKIQTHVYIDHFYMKGDKVTVEISRIDNRGHQTEGYIESMSNLTDEEIFNIAEDMIRNIEDNWD